MNINKTRMPMKPIQQTLRLNVPARFAIVALALLLSACGSFPQQNYPDNEYPGNEPSVSRVAGVVNYVDVANSEIEITTNRDYGVTAGQRVGLHYNNRTTVEFDGNNYRPQDLERGDRIVAEVEGDTRYLSARSILVTRDSSSGGGYVSDDQHDELHFSGTLRQIDKRNKRLIVDTTDRGREVQVRFNKRTQVFFGDRHISISELREYDTLNIELAPGKRNALAETITVVDGRIPSQYDDDLATARGEVVFVDESRRELVIATQDRYLQSVDSRSSSDSRTNFDTRKNDRATFLYERDIIVEYRGENFSPSNLENGDTIEVDYERDGDELWAQRVLVISNVRE